MVMVMGIFFEVMKGIFFFLTMVVGVFFLRGDLILSAQNYMIAKEVLVPGYLIFCGMMFGYIIARLWLGYDEEHPQKNTIYIKSFMIGISLGIFLAILYILI